MALYLLQFRKRRLQELLQLRKKEEADLKKAGHKNYKEIAEENYKVTLNSYGCDRTAVDCHQVAYSVVWELYLYVTKGGTNCLN